MNPACLARGWAGHVVVDPVSLVRSSNAVRIIGRYVDALEIVIRK